MIAGRDFVFTGLQPWDISIGSNAKDIALEVSKQNRVLYVNTPLDKITFHKNRLSPDFIYRVKIIDKQAPPLRKINNNLWVIDCPFTIWPVNSLPSGRIFDFINQINNKKIFNFIKQMLMELNFKNIIHFIDNDIYRSFYSKEYLQPALSIYYKRDNLLPLDFWKRHASRIEPLLIEKSDLVVCNSEYMTKTAKLLNFNSFCIGQGVDLSAYNSSISYKTPKDIIAIPTPIIGYIGEITSLRLNTDIIFKLAEKNPSYSFVMVGKADTTFINHPLTKLSNIYFLGQKPKEIVPAYMNAFDICINPQKLNEITIGNYPRKIDEYLALGKPVIATNTETMQLFKDYVYLCNSLEDYQKALNKILQEDKYQNKNSRIQFAQTHNWTNSVEVLYQSIKLKLQWTYIS